MFHFTYVLENEKDGRLYIGTTTNLKKRLGLHKQGNVKSTKNRRPLKLVYFEACLDKKKAQRRERYFKTGFGREFLKQRVVSSVG